MEFVKEDTPQGAQWSGAILENLYRDARVPHPTANDAVKFGPKVDAEKVRELYELYCTEK
jgi:hypothetical protein